MTITDEEAWLIQNLKRMSLLRKHCKFLSFCLISLKFLILPLLKKGNKGQLFFRAVRAPLAPTRISYAIERMLERLPIPLAQVKASNTSVNLLKKSGKSFSFSIEQKKSQKNFIMI